MTPDDPNKRFSNAIIYGTSHPEAYMTKADELWEKYAIKEDWENDKMTILEFLAALAEYGEAVRKQAMSACIRGNDDPQSERNAAAIEKMELP